MLGLPINFKKIVESQILGINRPFYLPTTMVEPASPLSPSQLNSDDDIEEESDDEAGFLNPKAAEKYVRPSRRKGRGKTGRTNSPKRNMDWDADASLLFEGEDEEGLAECDAALANHKLSITKHPWHPDFAQKGAMPAFFFIFASGLIDAALMHACCVCRCCRGAPK